MKKAFFSALLALFAVSVYAQNITVTGKVTDAGTGEGVPFISVVVKNTTKGVSSDVDGNYSIQTSPQAVLVFSAVGYATQEIPVEGRTSVNVRLQPDSEFLEETVIVGYGSAKKVNSLVGSVQTVNSETLKNAPSSSALDALQGQVAGLSVLSYSGAAGDNAISMSLHGVGSITASSAPLYVIDGIPSSSRAIMAMNPNDIESISILKDAAATSIYGSRAANGVVYVITKAGSYNERASVTVRSQYGTSTLANLGFYENMMTGEELIDFWLRSGIYTEDYIKATYPNPSNTQWYKIFMDLVNPQYQNDITIQGGGSKVAYMISGSQFHQKGYTPGNYFDRYTVRSNVQAHPFNWLKVGLNLNLSLDKTQQNPNWGSQLNGMSNATQGGLSYLQNPLNPAYDADGKLYAEKFPHGSMNPHYYMENHIDRYDRYGANGNFFIEIEPVKNLKFVSRSGVDGYIRINDWYTNPSYYVKYATSADPTAYRGLSTAIEYSATMTNTLEYSMDINPNNRFSVLVGHEGVDNDYLYYYAQSKGQQDDNILRLQDGTAGSREMSESMSQSRFLSFFGHADYSLFDRYYFDASIRNDASSRFGADVRNATFWSAGVRWNAKKESFLRNVGAVNKLDVKLSYGTQGNASIGDYVHLGKISASGRYQDVAGNAVTSPANSHLTWEQQNLFTAAVTTRLFDVVDLEVEYYNRQTSSMLMSVPNPYTAGFTSVTQNVGTLQNVGVDITLGIDILRSRDYFLRFNAIFSYNEQKVTELFDGRKRWEIANTGVAYVVGQPIMFYYPIYAGIDPADGHPMWYLPGDNKDVCTTDNGTTKVFDEAALTQNTGNRRYAPINGGISLSGGWKGLSVQADFSYVIGKYLTSNDGYFYANPANFSTMNTSKSVSDFWTPTHTDAKWPNWGDGVVMQFDTHLLEDASFMRLKNLQVAYALPSSWLGWTNGVIKDLKITFTGRNLLTFTNYSGIDPEINSNLSYGVAGNSKQYLGGIEITF